MAYSMLCTVASNKITFYRKRRKSSSPLRPIPQLQQLYIKNQSTIRRNHRRKPLTPISIIRATSQLTFLPDPHLRDAFVPASNYLPLTHFKEKRLASISGRVEFVAVGEFSDVVDVDDVADFGLFAVAVADYVAGDAHFF